MRKRHFRKRFNRTIAAPALSEDGTPRAAGLHHQYELKLDWTPAEVLDWLATQPAWVVVTVLKLHEIGSLVVNQRSTVQVNTAAMVREFGPVELALFHIRDTQWLCWLPAAWKSS